MVLAIKNKWVVTSYGQKCFVIPNLTNKKCVLQTSPKLDSTKIHSIIMEYFFFKRSEPLYCKVLDWSIAHTFCWLNWLLVLTCLDSRKMLQFLRPQICCSFENLSAVRCTEDPAYRAPMLTGPLLKFPRYQAPCQYLRYHLMNRSFKCSIYFFAKYLQKSIRLSAHVLDYDFSG